MIQKLIKIGLAFSVVFTVFTNVSAQTAAPATAQTPNVIFGITGGLSAPLGNFAKTDYKDPNSGFAGTGVNFGVTETWFLNKNFGISALASYHSYGIVGIDNLASGFQKDFFVDSASATNKGNSYSLNILVGPYYSMPLTDKFSIDLRLLIGVVDANLEGWDVILTDGHITHPALTQANANAVTFGMQAGLGFRYNINNHWAVMLNGDYFYSKPNFTIENVDRNTSTGREIYSYNQPFAGVNANLSLCYMLSKK